MGVNNLPKTVTRQRRGCDLNTGPSAPESSTLTTRLPSLPRPTAEKPLGQMHVRQTADQNLSSSLGNSTSTASVESATELPWTGRLD